MHKKRRKLFQHHGFTLVELMIVMAIIATLAGISVPFFQKYIQRAQKARLIAEMKMIEREIFAYQAETGSFPNSLADIGLDTLNDPWGNPYGYLKIEGETFPGKSAGSGKPADPGKPEDKGKPRKNLSDHPVNTDFDLFSMGPDGDYKAAFTAKASQDDFVRANNGDYFGIASEY